MEGERNKLQKIVLCVLAAMVVVFAVLTIVVRQHHGVVFEETLLDIITDGERTIYTGRKHGYDITILTYQDGSAQVVKLTIGDSINHLYRVEYPGGTIQGEDYNYTFERVTITDNGRTLFDGGYNPEGGWWGAFCDLNGEEVSPFYTKTTYYSDSGSSNPWYGYELHYSEVVDFANGPATSFRGSWTVYGFAVFFSVLCALATAFPYTLFYISHALSVQDPEPTELYMTVQWISSVLVTIVIFGVYIYGLRVIV